MHPLAYRDSYYLQAREAIDGCLPEVIKYRSIRSYRFIENCPLF